MSRASTGPVAVIVVLATVISAALIASYISESPDSPRCASCIEKLRTGNCGCSGCEVATEDYSLWGVYYHARYYLLGCLSLIALAGYSSSVAVDKALVLRLARKQTREFQAKINELIFEQRFPMAVSLSGRYKTSPLAIVVNAALQRNRPEEQATRGLFTASMEARHRAIALMTEEIKRGLWTLSAANWSIVLGAVLLFLITLISGLYWMKYAEGRGFSCIASYSIDAMWRITFSVAFAVPAIWWHKYLTATADSMILEMDRMSMSIIGGIVGRRSLATAPLPRSEPAFVTSDLEQCDQPCRS